MVKYSEYRQEKIEENLNLIKVAPLDIMVTGVTGAGKSTTINALLQKYIARVGEGVDPETMELNSYRLSDSIRLWDTPGLGDGRMKDLEHGKKIVDLCYKSYLYREDKREYGFIDMILVIIEGANRDMGTVYTLLNDVILPNFQAKRIVVAINQADVAMKGRHWDLALNKPDAVLYRYLEEQALSIKRRVYESTGIAISNPIYFSAKYDYNVDKLLDHIVDNMPLVRRKMEI